MCILNRSLELQRILTNEFLSFVAMRELFDLPDDLVRVSVLSCLSLKDLVSFDTAVLCRHNRLIYHHFLQNSSCDSQTTPVSNSSARWLHERLVRPASIRICWSVTDEVVPALAEVASRASSIELDRGVNSQRCPLLLDHLSSRNTNDLVHRLHMCEHSDGFKYESMPNLTHLHLPELNDQLIRGPWSRNLLELEIYHRESTLVRDDQLRSMVMHCPALRALSVVTVSGFTQQTAEAIAQHCPHIEYLKLICNALPKIWLEPIARGCVGLHTLCAGGSDNIPSLDCARGLECLPALIKLNLMVCPLSGYALMSLLSAHCPLLWSLELPMEVLLYETVGDDLHRLPALRELSGMPTTAAGPGLSLSAFRAICAAKPDLQKMHLSLDASLRASTASAPPPPLTQLRSLGLRNGDALGEETLCRIVSANPHLVELSLDEPSAGYIGDALMLAVAQCCKNMQTLRLYAGKRITDAGVIAVVQHCVHLQNLHLASDSITDASVLALTRHGSALTSLRLFKTKTTLVSKTAVFSLLAGCKKLTMLGVHTSVFNWNEAAELCVSSPITKRFVFAAHY